MQRHCTPVVAPIPRSEHVPGTSSAVVEPARCTRARRTSTRSDSGSPTTPAARLRGLARTGHDRRRRLHRRLRSRPVHRRRHRCDGRRSDRVRARQPRSGGRSDCCWKLRSRGRHRPFGLPTQINNVLAFPGFFRGMLDSGSHEITEAVMLAASSAIADSVSTSELNASYIVPDSVKVGVAGTGRSSSGSSYGQRRVDAFPDSGSPVRPSTRSISSLLAVTELVTLIGHRRSARSTIVAARDHSASVIRRTRTPR